MNFFHREGPAAQGTARRLAIKKPPRRMPQTNLAASFSMGAWEYEEFSVLLKSE